MHRCKACGSPVCDSRERRLLGKSTSISVRQELCDLTSNLDDNLVRFNEEHFSDGYLCMKCYMLVVKRSHLKCELKRIDSTLQCNLHVHTAASVFSEQGSLEAITGVK